MFRKQVSEFGKSLAMVERLAYLLVTLKGIKRCSPIRGKLRSLLLHEVQRLSELQK